MLFTRTDEFAATVISKGEKAGIKLGLLRVRNLTNYEGGRHKFCVFSGQKGKTEFKLCQLQLSIGTA
jgi:hypothetical protein